MIRTRTIARRCTAAVAALSLMVASVPALASTAPDTLIETTEVLAATSVRDRVHALLARDEVRAALAERGVAAAQLQARVDALTDDEARELAKRLDQAPAGGDVLGILFTVFIVLLVTDILGLTKVFPFTRPIR